MNVCQLVVQTLLPKLTDQSKAEACEWATDRGGQGFQLPGWGLRERQDKRRKEAEEEEAAKRGDGP